MCDRFRICCIIYAKGFIKTFEKKIWVPSQSPTLILSLKLPLLSILSTTKKIREEECLELVGSVTSWVSSNNHSSFLYVRLGQVKVNDCPAGLDNWPRTVRAPRRGQKQEIASVTKRRNTAPGFNTLDPTNVFHERNKNSKFS